MIVRYIAAHVHEVDQTNLLIDIVQRLFETDYPDLKEIVETTDSRGLSH